MQMCSWRIIRLGEVIGQGFEANQGLGETSNFMTGGSKLDLRQYH